MTGTEQRFASRGFVFSFPDIAYLQAARLIISKGIEAMESRTAY
jgi:hypothetical protein